MSDFKAKIHQIRFWPRPSSEAYSTPHADPHMYLRRHILPREGRGSIGNGRGHATGERVEKDREGSEKEGKRRREREGTPRFGLHALYSKS